MSTPEEFAQLKLNFIDPVQHHYEVIRPVVLFGETVAARSQQTGVAPTQISDKARRFVAGGMFALADQRADHAGRPAHDYPAPIAATILYLKQLYPPIHFQEIVRIVARKHSYTTNHSTVKRFLERHPIPVQLPLEWKTFHQFDDAYRARWTVVRMWAEGWSKKSIAGCLKLSRKHVHTVIAAFEQDGFAGLEDQRTRPPDHPANQLTLPLMQDILDIQRDYPRAGHFRVHGLLEQRFQAQGRADKRPSERTVGRAMAKNRQFHHAPGPWASDAPPDPAAKAVKALPYQPDYRHQYWFIDIRYTTRVANQRTYSICILEGYSRKLLAGMASPYQDLIAILQLLAGAIASSGCPAGIVSDNGAVFTAHAYQAVLAALGIEPCYIEKGKPWQNLIEAAFKVETRLADPLFDKAETLEELQAAHVQFLGTYNTTAHWAHQDREDELRTPEAVLGARACCGARHAASGLAATPG
jgi:transposase InsO family protein